MHLITVIKNYPLHIAAVLFIALRIVGLDASFLFHDERDIVFSGYSITKTGKDFYGNPFPLVFEGISPSNPLVTIYFSALSWVFMPEKNVFFARLPFVLVTTALLYLVYHLSFTFTKHKTLSLVTSLVFAFSPWIIGITRYSFEGPLALITLLLGMLFYLKQKRWAAYLLFFLSFYNYQAFRLLIPIVILYLEAWLHLQGTAVKTTVRNTIISMGAILVMFLLIFVIDVQKTVNRLDQVLFLSGVRFEKQINFDRSISTAPNAIKEIFDNKATAQLQFLGQMVSQTLNPAYLFFNGDFNASPAGQNIYLRTPQFYPILIVPFLVGLYFLRKKEHWFMAMLIVIGSVPGIFNTYSNSFTIRGILASVGYSFVIAYGLLLMHRYINHALKPLPRFAITFAFLSILLWNAGSYMYALYFKAPQGLASMHNEHEKLLQEYIDKNNIKKIDVYTNWPYENYMSYAFLQNQTDMSQIKPIFGRPGSMYYHGIGFHSCAENVRSLEPPVIIRSQCIGEDIQKEFSKKADAVLMHPYDTLIVYYVFTTKKP